MLAWFTYSLLGVLLASPFIYLLDQKACLVTESQSSEGLFMIFEMRLKFWHQDLSFIANFDLVIAPL